MNPRVQFHCCNFHLTPVTSRRQTSIVNRRGHILHKDVFCPLRSATQEKEAKVEVEKVEEGESLEMGTSRGRPHKRNPSDVVIAGVPVNPELFAIAMVYFVQGTQSLSSLAMSYFLKDTLMQSPAQVALLESYGTVPWLAKPLYGFASDSVPIFGYRHRSYLILCGILSTTGWVLLSSSVNGPWTAFSCLFVASLGLAACDVVIDSVVVVRSRGAPQSTTGSLQSLCWASSAVGGIVSTFSSGYLLKNYGPRTIFGIISLLPLIVSCSSIFVKEDPVETPASKALLEEGGQGVVEARPVKLSSKFLFQAKALWNAFNNKQIYLPAGFLFIWMATPGASSAMFFYYTEHLHFTPEFMGRIAFVGQVASLTGVGVYNYFLKDVPLRKMFKWTCILGTVLGSSQLLLVTGLNRSLGLSDELFVIGDSVILDILGKVSFMPVLVLAARICPDGVEASLFALLMSILNGGMFTGRALGGLLTQSLGVSGEDFTNLPLLIMICVACTLIPLPFLRLLPNDNKGSAG